MGDKGVISHADQGRQVDPQLGCHMISTYALAEADTIYDSRKYCNRSTPPYTPLTQLLREKAPCERHQRMGGKGWDRKQIDQEVGGGTSGRGVGWSSSIVIPHRVALCRYPTCKPVQKRRIMRAYYVLQHGKLEHTSPDISCQRDRTYRKDSKHQGRHNLKELQGVGGRNSRINRMMHRKRPPETNIDGRQ